MENLETLTRRAEMWERLARKYFSRVKELLEELDRLSQLVQK